MLSTTFKRVDARRFGPWALVTGASSGIGREFALGEMVLVLSRLLATHRVELPLGWTRPAPRAQVAVHPRGGMPLLVTSVTSVTGATEAAGTEPGVVGTGHG